LTQGVQTTPKLSPKNLSSHVQNAHALPGYAYVIKIERVILKYR